MDTMKDTTMQHVTDAVIAELNKAANDPSGLPVYVRAHTLQGILVRLEAAEKEQAALLDYLKEWKELAKSAEKERDALRAKIKRMQKALSFYADETRYYGPNQKYEGGDPWTDAVGLHAYQLDVTRDHGNIARAALEESK